MTRVKLTKAQLVNMAERACFYVTPAEKWLRMCYVSSEEDYFMAQDEDSGEEYRIDFSEILDDDGWPHFEELVTITVPKLEECRCITGPEWSGSPNPANPDTEWVCDDCGRVIKATV